MPQATVYTLIENAAAWKSALAVLQRQSSLAVDFEMENNSHHYGTHLALIQISTAADRHFVIDPLVQEIDLTPLGKLLQDPGVEIILHDADFDRRVCYHLKSWTLRGLFDTKLAAQLCGYRRFGLGALLKELFEVDTDKSFQRLNWLKRPLAPDALAYAVRDTAFLYKLREHLRQQLKQLGRAAWFKEECHRLERIPPAPLDSAGAHHRIKRSGSLTPRQLAVLRALCEFREQAARQINRPVHFIIRNELLLELAINPPASKKDLAKLRSVHPALKTRFAPACLQAIAMGLNAPEDEHPNWKRGRKPAPGWEKRFKAMTEWRAAKGAALDLEPHLLLPNDVLKFRARFPHESSPPEVESLLRDWQRELLWSEFTAAFPQEHKE